MKCINYSEEVDVLLLLLCEFVCAWWALHFAINLILSNTHAEQSHYWLEHRDKRAIKWMPREKLTERKEIVPALETKAKYCKIHGNSVIISCWCTHHFEENELEESKTKWTDVHWSYSKRQQQHTRQKKWQAKLIANENQNIIDTILWNDFLRYRKTVFWPLNLFAYTLIAL